LSLLVFSLLKNRSACLSVMCGCKPGPFFK
jgi:hypothetical protein